MYFIIPGESIDDPMILNQMRIIGLDVVKAPASSTFPYWYEFVIAGTSAVRDLLKDHVKPDWYAAEFDESSVTIIFQDEAFQVIDHNKLTSQAPVAVKAAERRGIQRQFLDWQERHKLYLEKLRQSKEK